MPVIMHGRKERSTENKRRRKDRKSGSALIEELLVRCGIGVMTGLVGFFLGGCVRDK